MIEDPIIAEVRQHRRARAARFHFSIDGIAEDARKRERTSGHRIVLPPKRKVGQKTGQR